MAINKFNFSNNLIEFSKKAAILEKDHELKQGSRIGMIRFGSRADLYFENYNELVKVNQKTIAGETLLAKK